MELCLKRDHSYISNALSTLQGLMDLIVYHTWQRLYFSCAQSYLLVALLWYTRAVVIFLSTEKRFCYFLVFLYCNMSVVWVWQF